jgi:hypothetical protein
MKFGFKMAVVAFGLAGLGAAVTGAGAAAQPSGARPVANIVGTWTVTATPDNPAMPPFQSTLAYTEGGVLIEATSKPFVAPVTDTSEGLGSWQMVGVSTLHLTFVKYLYNAGGQFIGTTTVVETDTVSGNTYMGHATATVRSPNGTVETSFGVSSMGQRMTT